MPGVHKILSPSKGAMWSRCLGSLAMGKGLPNKRSSFADEGTAYHYVAEQALNTGRDCSDWIGRTIVVTDDTTFELGVNDVLSSIEGNPAPFVVDAENAAFAQQYVDHIRENTLIAEFKTETKIDLSALLGVPDQGGTLDCAIFKTLEDTLEIHDLKFGRGEIVHPWQKPDDGVPTWMGANEQLMLYAAGALLMFKHIHDWKKVKLVIHQPRVGHFTYHSFRRDQVREFIRYIGPRAQEAYRLFESGTPEEIRAALTPGDKQCRWCPRRNDCEARTNQKLAEFPLMPAEQRLVQTGGLVNKMQTVVSPTPGPLWQISDEVLFDAYSRVDDIKQWCKDIEAEAYSRALSLEQQGKMPPDWKFAIGRKGNRQWDKDGKIVDEDELTGRMEYTIEEFMVNSIGTAAYEKPSIISPAAAEKAMKKHPEKWARLQALITQSEGNKTLVRATDPRPAAEATTVQFGLTDEFGANVS